MNDLSLETIQRLTQECVFRETIRANQNGIQEKNKHTRTW
jgi:hypothetical protein